jgi:hypothetical protein
MNSKLKFFSLIFSIAIVLAITLGSVSASISGANVSQASTSTVAANTNPDFDWAYAGNVSEITVDGFSTTQAWQGYFGNVSGVVQLADGNGKVMYNWSLASPTGEVYASTNNTVYWQYLQCFNFTATGSHDVTNDKAAFAGGQSQNGTNLTALEVRFNMSLEDVDGINETFIYRGGTGHAAFQANSLSFSAGECPSTRVFDNVGYGVQGEFEEALMWEPESSAVIFASLLEQDNTGFDAGTHDFEMLVPENGHLGDTTPIRYYFYLEIQ